MSTARERREKRRQQQTETEQARPRESRQVRSAAAAASQPALKLPFKLPFKVTYNRWLLLIPAAVMLAVVLIGVLSAINPPKELLPTNAIWLDRDFSYSAPSDEQLAALVEEWRSNQIGTVYLYASSLKADANWSGLLGQSDRFIEVEPLVASVVERLERLNPQLSVLAWIEVTASQPDYRLNSPQVRAALRDFIGRMVNGLKFTGVMLDIKPIENNNEDLPVILREARAVIGQDRPLAVAVPADLTPLNTDLNLPSFIAPGTAWDDDYKLRVSLQADQVVVSAYNSYITDPVSYINWVAYQVDAFTRALTNAPSDILIGIPNYALETTGADQPIPHTAKTETMAAALDGITQGLRQLPPALFSEFSGIAIYTDRALTSSDWTLIRQKYLEAALSPAAAPTSTP